MSEEPVVRVNNLKKYYGSGGFIDSLLNRESTIRAVDDVSLEIKRGEVYGLVGESGSGKSTMGETILMLERPTDGQVIFNGDDITKYSDTEMKAFRKNGQIIFQDPYTSLNPKKTVFNLISEPLRNFYDMSHEEREELVSEMLEELGLSPPEDYLYTYPKQLSGGQRQRINIARALIIEPEFVVADEPMSMLDVSIQAGIMKLLNSLREKFGITMLYISHNLAVVNLVADRIGVMYQGKIVEEGTSEEIIHNPKHPYTRALIQSLPDLSQDRERVILPDRLDDDTASTAGCSFYPRCPKKMDHCQTSTPKLADADGQRVACFLHHNEQYSG